MRSELQGIADNLVIRASAADPAIPGGPSAAVIGVSAASAEPVIVSRGHARVLDDVGHARRPIALAAEPVFDVGSITKLVVTTALAMTLVDRGQLRLDAPVQRWFADFAGDGKETVTVRDLLEHRGGLWEWWPTYVAGARSSADAVGCVQRLPLRYQPRSGRHYSDLGFMLLGEIVEREFAAPLDVVAERVLFAPLGMASTGFRPGGVGGADVPADRVVATSRGDIYERRMVDTGAPYPVTVSSDAFDGWRGHTLVGEGNDGNCWHAFGGVAGHAGLFTSAPDLLVFGHAVLSSLGGGDGGGGLWSRETVAEFVKPGRDVVQGLGFQLTGSFAGHPGFPGARFAVSPRQQVALVLLTNRLHTAGEPRGIDAEWAELMRVVEAGIPDQSARHT